MPGTDTRKMSKSYNNAVLLSDTREQVSAKIKTMYTDPKKIRVNDPGNPDGCVVYAMHKLFTPAAEAAEIHARCRTGNLGCVACKSRLSETMNADLEPLREARAVWEKRPQDVRAIVEDGSRKAAAIAVETMTKVRAALHLAAPLTTGALK